MPPTKTPDDDIESGQSQTTTINEETPLLISQSDHRAGPDDDTVEEAEQDERSRYTRSYFAWRIFWTVAAITVTVIFVKAWIDAGADVNFDLKGALKRALGGGISGAAAMVLQVLLLMPLRTIMNYQYRFGTSFTTATKTLYRQGGLRRYYDGMGAALFQGPAARFGDTAANAGIHALLQSNSFLKRLPITIQDIFASLCAAAFRMILTPIDTLKTTLQAQGPRGTAILRQRIKTDGIGSLWWGAFATAAATFVGNYPWYATHDYLLEIIPEPAKHPLGIWLLRLAFAGFVASVVSDSVSNSLRVVKTYRQVNDKKVSYSEAARLVIVNDGIKGLLGRGLKTRILCNGLQGLMFSILWKLFLDLYEAGLYPDMYVCVQNAQYVLRSSDMSVGRTIDHAQISVDQGQPRRNRRSSVCTAWTEWSW
ncbi:mitochondrial carrier domain-containing protein [Neurospora hispaniola]|uniref:Mitochondrial carrier domain-containing protein n=1 Tax=Neurospora hispaniola TaxID=588809 RepID=A0AAJ0MUP8_9PEZI|nr:mitochondrial carrier domain-containing protein [Neurospora hispaniola]